MSRVDLGFLENTDTHLLQSHFFPSKIGGKPAWLALKDLPATEDLQCEICTHPLVFLGQVYAPFEEDPKNFHRTLFVFVCRNAQCCKVNQNTNLRVWRSSLGKENEFYPSEPPNDDSQFDVGKFLKLCFVCGCLAEKHCSKCKDTSYCSREHQVADWKAGHKFYCKDRTVKTENKTLFTESELVIEEEENTERKHIDEKQQMEEYEKLVQDGKTGTLDEVSEEELQSHAAITEDKVFLQFRKRIDRDPEQVLRYNRGGEPLWIAKEPKPTSVPACEYCGAERQFEFQILPQLLFSLKEDKLDWGTLLVYSCKNSCTDGPMYKKEYIFKQDVSG